MSKDTGVIYFSRDGSTRVLAEMLGKKYDADVIELTESGKKSGFFQGASKANKKQSVELTGEPYNKIDTFKKLYLCTPIWAFNGTPAMNAFIENADFTDKEIVVITVKGFAPDGALGKTHTFLTDSVEKKNGTVSACYDVHGAMIGKAASEAHMKEQIDKLKI